ncbi:uncharacterized protein CC84DRAFT_7485 [Paraphaeosphaeria sporulosa]|uniref:Uncharacterized protein n=1 Tax=Paraphaeosphaeria sporulosa TaxID=1460663 RepID=A0A177CX39_9PLEO|nr:uncharacterized protein CC84DRAFT_7485 [Paraphaeosphaeria sporulosa]OAG11289.1 hypothetical protein CC84DRAFT_7485 [Paraphaeosphaeria sporulosa]
MSLATSRYAPKTPLESLVQSKAEKLKQDKARTTRLLNRLQWKAESLAVSYVRAIEILRAEVDQNGNIDSRVELRYAFMRATNSKQAESMFKVDFFEFYTLLERYISTSLEIMGVHVSGTAPRTNVNALKYITNPDLHRIRPRALHAFHANLLEALDDPKCPLHISLGNQEVRIQLGIAKDYRNAWKDADEKVSKTGGHNKDDESRKNVNLTDLDLDTMLRYLLAGCEHAHGIVQDRPDADPNSFTSRDFEQQAQQSTSNAMETDDVPFEYMDDAMDLD